MAVKAPEASVEVACVGGYPSLAPRAEAAPFARRVAAIAGRGNGGAVDFGTEAGLYEECLGVPVVVCGPGSMAQGHTADEFLAAAELAAGEAFVAGLLEALADHAAST